MDVSETPEEVALRKRVRAWLKTNVPRRDAGDNPIESGVQDTERVTRAKLWQRKLYDAGFVAMGWPKEFGYSRTARRSVEIHGGIGFTWEFDLRLWFKRAHVAETLFGDPTFHRERVATLSGW